MPRSQQHWTAETSTRTCQSATSKKAEPLAELAQEAPGTHWVSHGFASPDTRRSCHTPREVQEKSGAPGMEQGASGSLTAAAKILGTKSD